MVLMGAAFTSCSKDIAFDSEAVSQQNIAEYQANFVKKYGPVDPNQTWDFSDLTPMSSFSDGSANTRSVAGSGTMTITRGDGTIKVDEKFLKWVHTNLKAGANNATQGNPFLFTVPDNEFTIAPIFQGIAVFYWELWMHVGSDIDGEEQYDELIWSKGEDLKYKVEGDDTWHDAGTGENGTLEAVETEGPTFTFEGLPAGRALYFYLKVWESEEDFEADTNKDQASYRSSTDNYMLALKVPSGDIPANVPFGENVNIIGCEDKTDGDFDYEDLVFLTDGLEINKVKNVTRKQTKRYLIEDLGSLDDFDFNDIVVDMSEVWIEDIDYEYFTNGGWKEKSRMERENSRHQEAIIRAMGGTINFQLFIGDDQIYEKAGHTDYAVTDMLNTGWNGSPIKRYAKLAVIKNCILDEDGKTVGTPFWTWNKNTNNIAVAVENHGDNGGEVITKFKFPKQGEVPMIIATKTHKFGAVIPWMKERQSIPESWFYIPPVQP